MIILGIDPGLANTGWGVVETRGSVCRARAYGCVSTSSAESIDRRLGKIYEGISKAIETYAPSQLAIEKIFFGENSRSALATAHARGAALVAAAEAGLELGEYTPMQIKQAVVGTGSAYKRQVIFMVRNILALDHDPRPDHCADALAAAICHANLTRTHRLTREGAAVQVFEQERAQEELDAATARSVTAAATAARLAGARGEASPLG
ncbi:crossover junction endodeoxyribonuclease RuvC, partial [Tractidigestivibacter sp.]|uniref:crossover junction endodeoxyribonuclease RuvC n=1 Tax=Tractidigestivibacter sp. TaxID=2847320 RepID=UPI003FD78D82